MLLVGRTSDRTMGSEKERVFDVENELLPETSYLHTSTPFYDVAGVSSSCEGADSSVCTTS